MQTCVSCGTTLIAQADFLRDAGDAGTMHAAPMLCDVGDLVEVRNTRWQVKGHVRYDYGPGWWDEFWITCPEGRSRWLSVDEGDLILQRQLARSHWPPLGEPPPVGATVSLFKERSPEFEVYETGQGRCTAFRGAFPEII